MKRFTTLVAAAAAMMAMMAMFAGSASAGTVLCSQAEEPCAQSNILPAGSNFRVGNIHVASFQIGNSLKCTNNALTAKSTMRNGNPLPAEFSGQVNPSSCTIPAAASSSCTGVTMNSPPTNVRSTGAENGVVEIGSSAQPLTISTACTSSVGAANCVWKANGTVNLNVSSSAAATIEAPLTKVSGNFLPCAGNELTVNDVVSENHISSATETVFCAGVGVEPCPNGLVLPSGTRLATGGFNGFELSNSSGRVLNCQDSMTFDSTQEAGAPLPTSMGAAIDVGSCLSWTGESCSAASWNTPASSVEATGSNKAVVRIGSTSNPLTLTTNCNVLGGSRACTWSASGTVNLNLDVAGNATVAAAPMNLIAGSSFWCRGTSANLTVERSYGSINDSPLFVALI